MLPRKRRPFGFTLVSARAIGHAWNSDCARPIPKGAGESRAPVPAAVGMSMKREPRSSLFVNGSIVLPDGGRASAAASVGGLISCVGDEAAARDSLPGVPDVIVDLGGGTALPGFSDSHVHVLNFGRAYLGASCWPDEVSSIAEIVKKVRGLDSELPTGRWLRGRGFDPARLAERRAPLARELDLPSRRPVVLDSFDYHRRVVNSSVLDLAEIDTNTPDPKGGYIVRDHNGVPTGELLDAARELVDPVIPPWTGHEDREAFVFATDRLVAAGFTHVTNAAPLGILLPGEELQAFARAAHDRVSKVRLSTTLRVQLQDQVEELGLTMGFGNDDVWISGLKIFSDGAFGPRTAYLHEPYEDSETTGYLSIEVDELRSRIKRASGLGWRVCVHAVGDRAIDIVTEAIRECGQGAMLPHRIEHCCLTHPETIKRMAEARIIPVPQMPFLRERSGDFAAALGELRMERLFPLRSWINAGLTPLHSSDAPVSKDLRPMAAVYTSVTRKDGDGHIWGADERISLDEAIAMLTVWPAKAEGQQSRRGRLERGFLADVTVLEADPWDTPSEELQGIEATMTIVGGEMVWSR